MPSLKNIRKNTILVLSFILSLHFAPAFAADKSANEELDGLQKQARSYREHGLRLQRRGELEGAIDFYKKAATCDPDYAVVYNDLGVVYETQGLPGAAEESYLKAIKIAPFYLSPYSNLALLYEDKHVLDKAAYYWQRRAELGYANDPWTAKAFRRLEDIRLVSGGKLPAFSREREVSSFAQELIAAKTGKRQEEVKPAAVKVTPQNRALAQEYFAKAKASLMKGDGVAALKEAMQAQQRDPTDKRIFDFINELQSTLLSK